MVRARHRSPHSGAFVRLYRANTLDSNDKGATRAPLRIMAEWTGLEPATSGVTGQHSNQLNYRSALSTAGHVLCPYRDRTFRFDSAQHSMASPRGFEPLLLP